MPESPRGEQPETDKVSAFPKPLPLCVWQSGNSGNQSKNTPLECMINNFKKGFNVLDYRVNS
jgi:hypothetical protein